MFLSRMSMIAWQFSVMKTSVKRTVGEIIWKVGRKSWCPNCMIGYLTHCHTNERKRKRGKTHSTVGNYHNHFPRTRLAVVFHVKCQVIIDDLLTAFVIIPGRITNTTRSSNLVTSAAKGYTWFVFAYMENPVMRVMVVVVELGNFVKEFLLICCE